MYPFNFCHPVYVQNMKENMFNCAEIYWNDTPDCQANPEYNVSKPKYNIDEREGKIPEESMDWFQGYSSVVETKL